MSAVCRADSPPTELHPHPYCKIPQNLKDKFTLSHTQLDLNTSTMSDDSSSADCHGDCLGVPASMRYDSRPTTHTVIYPTCNFIELETAAGAGSNQCVIRYMQQELNNFFCIFLVAVIHRLAS